MPDEEKVVRMVEQPVPTTITPTPDVKMGHQPQNTLPAGARTPPGSSPANAAPANVAPINVTPAPTAPTQSPSPSSSADPD